VDVHSSRSEDAGHSGEAPTVSAEQLAIALMGEARRLYGRCADPYQLIMQRQEVREVADRLAEWATDARKLGVASQQRYETIEKARELAKARQEECRGDFYTDGIVDDIMEALDG
jgi:hypothetical protein